MKVFREKKKNSQKNDNVVFLYFYFLWFNNKFLEWLKGKYSNFEIELEFDNNIHIFLIHFTQLK